MSTPYEQVKQQLQSQPTKWLVTGCAGFIGSHLIDALLRLGQTVVGLDNFLTGRRSNLQAVLDGLPAADRQRFELHEGDIRDPQACTGAMKGVSRVLHQAALGSVPRSMLDPLATHDINVTGTLQVLWAAHQAQVQSVVYASSSSVYGDNPTLPKAEANTGSPLSPYAASKAACELYAGAFARAYSMRLAGLRYFNVVGPRQDPEGPYAAVVPRWIAALRRGESPVIYGDGQTSRDFCPVDNVVQANLLAAMRIDERPDQVYNVALGNQTTLLELFTILRDGMADRGHCPPDLQPTHQDFRPGDIRHSLADTTAIQEALGYTPTTTVAQALAAAMDEAG